MVHDGDPLREPDDDLHAVLDERTVLRSSRCTERISSTRPSTSSAETPAIGSSSRITRGSPASSIASSSFRLSPCESFPPGHAARRRGPPARAPSARGRAPAGAGGAAPDASVPPRCASAASRTFSATRQQREDARDLERPAEPGLRAAVGRREVTSRPSSSTLPAVGRTSPESRLKSVVFPAPFGPMMPTNSPSRPRARHRRRCARRRCRARGRGWRGSGVAWPRSVSVGAVG